MPPSKRRLLSESTDDAETAPKRQRVATRAPPPAASRDFISRTSDELLVRILSYMSERTLLDVSLVSKRFHAISADSQLWRPHYYRRFILPRAHRIPGFTTTRGYSSGPAGDSAPAWRKPASAKRWSTIREQVVDQVDWKKQYRLRHNWAGGRCAVEEVEVHDVDKKSEVVAPPEWQTLIKVVEGIAVTVDALSGIRAWDLRTRQTIAQTPLESDRPMRSRPSCLAVDDARLCKGQVDVAVGFEDGTSGVWRLDARRNTMKILFRQEKGFLGSLLSIAYGYPYLLTATTLGFIALYTFNHTSADNVSDAGDETDNEAARAAATRSPEEADDEHVTLPPPYLLTSLKSHSTQGPLSLSLRKNASSVVASVAYTFNTVGGWSIGIQDLDIRPSGAVVSRVATSLPIQLGSRHSPAASPLQPNRHRFDVDDDDDDSGPVKLRYSHPYLLVTLPDNTLVLHLCTATATTLTISAGVRLWGHTSGISDAEITPRGKAVSVSARGDEIRLWDLEGRLSARSVAVRPRLRGMDGKSSGDPSPASSAPQTPPRVGLDDVRRNRVGFDDEVVLVLKEATDGRDSLTLYDFT
ncbi:F-box domain containing protein [Cordyceps fumosorosea ARSEF 2679]|uniref:F-box domain containing protein n=1 Tax=Cordyceps fumosorosea (strain ARSEF 2679) TaxID=1081104 RepID=A0A162ICH9_CORFA|nr:F-box domain containing protein [Cordyceps fumosorosea ARSEF 2679]OAA55155.1 F-box domain containing protein [Cordyceps fumosorosea ARSEF 2679]